MGARDAVPPDSTFQVGFGCSGHCLYALRMDVLGTVLIVLVGLVLTVWIIARAVFAEIDKATGRTGKRRAPGEGKVVESDPIGSGVPTDGGLSD